MPSKAKMSRFEARIAPGVRTLIRRAAALEGRTMTDFVFDAAQAAARRAIDAADQLRLSVDDQHRFAESLLRPPAPTAALRRAFQRRARLLSGA